MSSVCTWLILLEPVQSVLLAVLAYEAVWVVIEWVTTHFCLVLLFLADITVHIVRETSHVHSSR